MKIAMINHCAAYEDIIKAIDGAPAEQLKSLEVAIFYNVTVVRMSNCEVSFDRNEWQSILNVSPLLKMICTPFCKMTLKEILSYTQGRYTDPDSVWEHRVGGRIAHWIDGGLIEMVSFSDEENVFQSAKGGSNVHR